MHKRHSFRLSRTAFLRWAAQHNLSAETIRMIERIRTSPPSRRTQGRRFDSSSYEFPVLLTLLKRPDVLHLVEQPPQVVLRGKAATARCHQS